MSKLNKYTDLVFLIVLGFLSVRAVYEHFQYGYVLSINNYLAFIVWIIAFAVLLVRPGKATILMLMAMFLSALNIINFTSEIFKAGISNESNGFESLTVNPLALLLLVIYCLVNREAIKILLNGSNAEKMREQDRMIDFYYKKFISCSKDELNKVFESFDEYPIEAKMALKKIKAEIEVN
ncbi:MAG: hypothetical protein JWP37_1650 [Mucilaginibacter sp.]|nr:hypothetical protein [Mucilaginibacter sp.]